MNSNIEFEGKNVEEAIKAASNALKMEKKNIKYDVISLGSRGLFGIGARNAVISVLNANEKETTTTEESKNIVNEIFNEPEKEKNNTADDNNDVDDTNTNDKVAECDEGLIEAGKTALERIITAISSESSVIDGKFKNKEIYFNIKSPDSAILIGKNGNTLDALQFILEKIINKKLGENKRVYVQIDVEGYLEAKKSKLINFALKTARQVERRGKPLSMGEKNFSDRRIIHRFLKSNNKIKVISRGEGPFKKLIIFPAKEK